MDKSEGEGNAEAGSGDEQQAESDSKDAWVQDDKVSGAEVTLAADWAVPGGGGLGVRVWGGEGGNEAESDRMDAWAKDD
jgi:hypothetical protein